MVIIYRKRNFLVLDVVFYQVLKKYFFIPDKGCKVQISQNYMIVLTLSILIIFIRLLTASSFKYYFCLLSLRKQHIKIHDWFALKYIQCKV